MNLMSQLDKFIVALFLALPSITIAQIPVQQNLDGNYYVCLGVPYNADQVAIKKAFRQLALKYHPDQSGYDSKKDFQKLNDAYETLSDPQKKERYDLELGLTSEFRIHRTQENQARLAELRSLVIIDNQGREGIIENVLPGDILRWRRVADGTMHEGYANSVQFLVGGHGLCRVLQSRFPATSH